MSTSNPPVWGADWEKWFKSPWWSPQSGQGMPQDPAAVFANMANMWFGEHPVLSMPAGSMSSLMKDVGMAYADLMRHATSHQAILVKGWQAAFAAFGKDLTMGFPAASDAPEADTIESLDELVARWTATAEPVLQQHAKSKHFITSQSDLMRAAMTWQKAQTALGEAISKQMGIPTRSEVDEAYRMIHELRRTRRRDEYARSNRDHVAPPSDARKRNTRAVARRGES